MCDLKIFYLCCENREITLRLVQAEGQLAEAVPLFRRELEGCANQYGAEHQETRTSAGNLCGLLMEMGHAEEAAALSKRFGL